MEPAHIGGNEPLTPGERQFLIDSGAPADSFDPAAKEAARERLRARAEETRRKASPELTASQVADLLDCASSQVIDWTETQDLYAYETEGGLRFPEWQFPDGQRLQGLRRVLRELGPHTHPYSVEGLLADVAHEELDELTAVAWLARGGSVEPVVTIARSNSYM